MTSSSKEKICEKCGTTFAIHFSPEGALAEKCNCSNNIWQPISTAPKDGSRILCTNKEDIEIARWSDSPWTSEKQPDGTWGAWLIFNSRSDSISIYPTHWMPLPKPPVPAIKQKEEKKFTKLLEAEDSAEIAMRLYIREFMLSKWKLVDEAVRDTKIFNYSALEQRFMVQVFYTNGRTEAFSHSFHDVERWEENKDKNQTKE